ncbi:unnamed protein product, partial [marine sediment metagenome]
ILSLLEREDGEIWEKQVRKKWKMDTNQLKS